MQKKTTKGITNNIMPTSNEITTFEIWSLIISAVAAVATFAAVIVALWQTKYANRKRVKLKSSTQALLPVITMETGSKVLSETLSQCVDITNIGNRDIVIDGFSIEFSRDFMLQIVDFMNIINPQLPIKIAAEERERLQVDFPSLCEMILKNKKTIGKFDKKLKFCITDSTGKKYRIKSNRTIENILALQNNK
ncbi:MAG: hypothetical protein FWE77_01930 [Clostridia bacterium]|nr:hypothetical protein [Clostridia bacterium]